ncbi:hypothetical protein [Microbacterium ulmi]|uniref:Uncharacterized protein n=1 Tax=Microbacterium ulmi TaxID=179095 RepID=A0A7Y2LXL7_9MICO|nr:hypothetical protein [Microbacterium ulmi]NII71170.1 hypothetical protein [Microbacterium ulmi]NNH02477.1 hypothetical protein [Microbacterium ulmi]
MSQRLLFPDHHAAADALTFASRAARLGDGAVRLRAADGVLAMTSAPFAPRGLLDSTPTVLGLRVLRVDAELVCDLVVEASELVAAPDDGRAVVLPETGLAPPWAGVSPPRGGWSEDGAVAASVLATRAQWGIAAVAEAMPQDPGEDIVRTIRASVWGVPDDALGGLPLGVAFAAFGLGFIAGDEQAQRRTAGAWTRLTLARGHVLVRGPVRTGLTPVRTTGTPR